MADDIDILRPASHDTSMNPNFRLIFLLLLPALAVRPDALEDLNAFIAEAKASGKIDTEAKGWRTSLPKFPSVAFAEDEAYEWVLETGEGTLVARLEVAGAPEHVRNVLYLSQLGFYDGLVFHRIIPGFMAQGGCPRGRGTGNPGYNVKLEVNPDLKHEGPGVLSMARSNHPDSAGSQFFLTFKSTPFLDGNYTVFGKVIEGREVLKKLEAAGNPDPRANGTPPLKRITIDKASVRRAGGADPAP